MSLGPKAAGAGPVGQDRRRAGLEEGGKPGPGRLRGDPESTEEVSAAGGSPWARLSSRWSSWLCLQPRATPTPPEARALQPAAHSL